MSLLGIIISPGKAGTLEAFKHTLFANSFLCRRLSLSSPVLREELTEGQFYLCFVFCLLVFETAAWQGPRKEKVGDSMGLYPHCCSQELFIPPHRALCSSPSPSRVA